MLRCLLGTLLMWMYVQGLSLAATPAAPKTPLTVAPPKSAALVHQAPSQPSVIAPSQLAASKDLESQIAVLKSQLEVTRSFQSDVLTTVYWALGFLGTLTVVLIGYNWFTNFRIYQREKQALLQELMQATQHRNTQVEQSLRAEAQTERGRIDTAFETLRTDILRRLEESVATQREAADTAISALTKKLEASIEASEKRSKRAARLVNLRFTAYTVDEARIDEEWSVLVSHALEYLNIATSLGNDWFIKDGLEALDTAINNGGEFNKSEVAKASEVLKKVPANLRELADEISGKLKSVKVT